MPSGSSSVTPANITVAASITIRPTTLDSIISKNPTSKTDVDEEVLPETTLEFLIDSQDALIL